ncbi:hypothetical protein L208DRAFT_1338747 [Tricholoma matsutake]|nr:hypothetical protein L208DRAFT_1338747 [Tricholoma matsutake 945]
MLARGFLLPLSTVSAAQSGCIISTLPIQVSVDTIALNLDPPSNQTELTGILTRFASQTSNFTESIMNGTTKIEATYQIYTQLCVPDGFTGGIVELAIHGINFDHSYWTIGGSGSQYNYVESALKAGHAILIYDRLSVGSSSKPDGIKEAQISTEIEIAAKLVDYLRSGEHGYQFGSIIGIGHSFGSLQLLGLASKYGNYVNATILTGFTPYTGGTMAAFAGLGLTIASVEDPARFDSLSSSYLATQGMTNDQLTFYRYPAFDPEILEQLSSTRATVTLGELFTQTAKPALSYSNPLLVLTGDKDFIFCGGNCYQSMNGSSNLVEPSKHLFPAVSDFNFNIPAETGHGINAHYSAPGVYRTMQDWIKGRFGG